MNGAGRQYNPDTPRKLDVPVSVGKMSPKRITKGAAMLDTMLGKMVNGVVSFASLAFSSFKGNDVDLAGPIIEQGRNQIVIEGTLLHAFDNDFDEIFRSGKEIEVWFVVTVEEGKHKVVERYFRHKVKYNPMTRDFSVELQEQGFNTSIRSYGELLKTISHFEYTWEWRENVKPGHEITVHLTSYLNPIKLDAYKKDFDLMMLWKFTRPHGERTFRINRYGS
jgi:hypothetical protein